MVVRKDLNVESIGIMAELPPDLSPLQIGARGEWKGKSFELVGRIRVEYELGSWNEWYALFADGTGGWLAEAQGFYMVSFEARGEKIPDQPEFLKWGDYRQFAGKKWSVSDIKMVRCCAGEGELPFAAPPGFERKSVDFTSSDGAFASLELSEGERLLYVGAYAGFGDLHFSNLRPVPGWSVDAPEKTNQTTALNCPGCGAVVNIRAVGQTMSAVCGSCGAVIDTANPVWTLVQGQEEKIRQIQPVLPIGARGNLEGVDYEVIGLMQRADNYSAWSEYLLFNPWQGFEWLVTYQGHWSFVHRQPEIADLSGPKINYAGRRFTLYAREEAKVTAVLGEFYWKVKRGERALLTDYIDPPAILSKETYPDLQEFTWSLGKYLDAAAVGVAFKIKDLPKPAGIYLNQPNPYWERIKTIRGRVFLFFVLFSAIQFITASHSQSKTKVAYDVDLVFQRGNPTELVVSPTFDIDGGPQMVEIEADAQVDNNWLSLDLELVNAQTRQVYPQSIELEYYHGRDEDGPWSEGARSNLVAIPSVPPGQYYLTIEPGADPSLARMPYHVKVSCGGVFVSNYILGLMLILAYPFYLLVRKIGFDNRRWAESDYTPFGLPAKHDD
jgi:Domain of unknown function (DUF4178)